MKNYLKLFTVITASITTTSYAQTIQQKIEEHSKDKKSVENAAKADVLIINKKNIWDSTGLKETKVNAKSSTIAKDKAKKKKCKKN
jgi:hypothetical protein